jgi:glycosyltransferase involved in cell wall biosynthesis
MPGPKVLAITRRFWPFCDDACQRLVRQFASFQRIGCQTSLLTARWHSSWPEYSLCRDVPVHRLLPGPNNSWNESHFQRNILQWISKRIQEFDCIYVDRADGLLSAIVNKANKWDLPIIARFSPDDSGIGLSNGQRINPLAMADACRRCAKVVAPTRQSHRLLIAQGLRDNQIVRIPDPAWERFDRTDESRVMASHALFETSSDFVIPGRSSIVVHLGHAELKPLKAAIQAVCDFLDLGVMLRVWIVGCGIPPTALYDLIKSRGWHREVLIFDGFDELQELIRVADLALVSNPTETLQFTLPILGQAGVPMIISENAECRAWLPDSNHFQLCSATEHGFSEKLQDWITHRGYWTESANTLRQHLRRIYSSEECTTQWLNIFRDTSIEHTA